MQYANNANERVGKQPIVAGLAARFRTFATRCARKALN